MDYLTILTTRSLLLFPSPSTLSPPAGRQSPSSSPNTPTSTLSPPQPISIPLGNLLSPDSQLFFFLHSHVIGRSPHGRDETREAEVMVWRELDKAGTFLRELGMAAGRGELRERGLRALAGQCGLVLCPTKEEAGGEFSRGAKRGGSASWTGRDAEYASQNGEGTVVMA